MNINLFFAFLGQTIVTGWGDVSLCSKVVVPSANEPDTSSGWKSSWNSWGLRVAVNVPPSFRKIAPAPLRTP